LDNTHIDTEPGKQQLVVGAEDGKGGDVVVAGLRGVFLHLGEDVFDYAVVVVLSNDEQVQPQEHV
jgi:hypothetical protein